MYTISKGPSKLVAQRRTAWQQVQRQLAGERGPRPVQYVERSPNPRLQGFVPIDLDEWWAQQFLARVTSCS
ncbi:MAPK regulated corepressor interacting protein 2 isoform X3 [Ochotona curzoniae]|uniref:MAPK regulated corepressor interacting protein 2 isoform X3 n=1 Tax=Ochotona curzoniae TaxID=130825 RepID=UPI001B34C8FC|nr:MAPK regulated corepressor interacting protein 2 isoform X3 [Ochotona curzoniae]